MGRLGFPVIEPVWHADNELPAHLVAPARQSPVQRLHRVDFKRRPVRPFAARVAGMRRSI